jgi:tetratricopeptide (TPR) repeat protein
MRYLLPVLPLAIYYALKAAKAIRFGELLKGKLAAAVLVLAMIPNLLGLYEIVSLNVKYDRSPEQLLHYPILPAAFRYQWKKIGAWIQANVPGDAVLASPVKDIVLVTGGRKVVEIDPVVTLPEFENLLRNDLVDYVFAPAQWRDLRAYEFPMRESRRFWFEPVPGLPGMMKVHSRFLEPAVRTPPHEVFDTLNQVELMRKGRSDLAAGRNVDALRNLKRVLELAPAEAEAVYEVMIADLMNDDMADAGVQYQRILGLQQTYSYIDYGRRHWDAAERLADARSSAVPEERSTKLFEAASLYWKMGYPVRAEGILRDLLAADSSYFAALQWGVNISLQLRDTARASRYLSRLEDIDAANPVVKTFRRVFRIGDSLDIVRTGEGKSRLHMELAFLYDGIGLGQEALDEAEMAAREDSSDMKPLLFTAGMLDRGSHLLAAQRLYRRVIAGDPGNAYAVAKMDSIKNVLSSR